MRRTFVLSFALTLSASASTFQLVTNGGFESGLANWTSTETVTSPSLGCATLWVVSNTGSATNCTSVGNPVSGSQAAYTSFDGFGVGNGFTQFQNYTLAQSIVLPGGIITGATLSFHDTFDVWIYLGNNASPRTFHIDIRDLQGALLANLFTQQFNPTSDPARSPWVLNTADVTTVLQSLAGQTVRLEIVATIPDFFTGPSGFGLDNISPSGTVSDAPEPGTYGLLIGALGLLALKLRRSK